MPFPTTPPTAPTRHNWGRAAKFDFDNAAKWVTETDVPLLYEHEITNDNGQVIGVVDREKLQRIAENGNRRVYETGDPAPLIVGHTSDDPKAPEKPVRGYAVQYSVRPYKRDENGQVIHAVFGNLKAPHKHKRVLEDFPRRSVELWLDRKEIDPIALLGGTTPEQDLGVVLRHARLKAVGLLGGSTPQQYLGNTFRYDRRSGGTVFRFAMEDSDMPCPPGMNSPDRYAMDDDPDGDLPPDDDGTDDFDEGSDLDGDDGTGSDFGDDAPPDGVDADSNDPVLAKVFASKQWTDAMGKIDEMYNAIVGGEGGAPGGAAPPPGQPGMDAMGGDSGMDAPGGDPGMDAMGGDQPGVPPGAQNPEDEAAMYHDEPPVRFESSGFPGAGSTMIPGFGGKKKSMSRNTNGSVPMNRNGAATAGRPQSRPAQRPAPAQREPELVRLRRQVQGMHLKLARAEAEKTINSLEAEGIMFADKAREIEMLAVLPPEEQTYVVNEIIKKNYQRRDRGPAHPSHPGLAQYARGSMNGTPGGDDEYAPENPEESQAFADLQTVRKMNRAEAVKYMRTKFRR